MESGGGYWALYKGNVTLVFKKEGLGNYGLFTITLVKHMKDREVTGKSKNGFTKGEDIP